MSPDIAYLIAGVVIAIVSVIFVVLTRRRRSREIEAMAVMIHRWLGNVSGIRAAAELLNGQPAKNGEPELVVGIAHAADRLRASLETAMHDVRIGTGKLPSRAQATDVPALLEEIVEDLSPLARIKRLELTLRCVDIPASLMMDRTAIEMSAYHLIENAIKYTSTGSVAVEVALAEKRLTLTVTDTGCGLPEHIAKGVFQKFYRGTGSFGTRGAGLGLYVVDQLVRAAGGSLAARGRTDGDGSILTVSLPVDIL